MLNSHFGKNCTSFYRTRDSQLHTVIAFKVVMNSYCLLPLKI